MGQDLGEVITITVRSSEQATREEWLQARILSILKTPSYSLYLGWSWIALRQRIGGKIRAGEFRAAIDRLIDAGEIVEFWLESAGPEPTHRLTLSRYFKFVDRTALLKARGRRGVIPTGN